MSHMCHCTSCVNLNAKNCLTTKAVLNKKDSKDVQSETKANKSKEKTKKKRTIKHTHIRHQAAKRH